MNRRNPTQVNGTATGLLNPHNPYWGRFEGGGGAIGGVADQGINSKSVADASDMYARMQQLRDKEIDRLKEMVFAARKNQNGRVLQPVDETKVAASIARANNISLTNALNMRQYGAKPDPYGAFSRSINPIHSFSYEPRDAYTYEARYTAPQFGF